MIEVSNISKSYGKKQVLKNVSLDARAGERIVIVGRNGCGKTTLLKILAGAMAPDGGSLNYFGEEPLKDKTVFRRSCGYVPQENPLFEELSVKDNLKFWGAGKKENLNSVIEQFQLEEMLHMKVEKLSGGMKRRLAIACAFVELPPVLLLDEPTAALDIYYKESILEWLSKYKQMNGTIIMTSHEEQEIVFADRCLLMDNGQMRELSRDPQKRLEEIKTYISKRT